jgi:hypothetical protein
VELLALIKKICMEGSQINKINLIIKSELLLLFTKKGSDKFNVGFESDFDEANNGIIK